ncbi:MAG: T9SS type A sorting domain-containing protein [candidate division Zixibacteria bacterium]|nr:T9SS type A sorting domain-containing protein [candidate division Zixibacteria bacterium]
MKWISTVLIAIFLTAAQSAWGQNLLWDATYGGEYTDRCNSIRATDDGGFIIAGLTFSYSQNPGVEADAWLLRLDSDGNIIWSRTYGGADDDRVYYVEQTDDGGFIALGRSFSFDNSADLYLIKTDLNGDLQWSRNYGGDRGEAGRHIEQVSDGGYLLSGYTHSFGEGDHDSYHVRVDSIGNVIWERAYDRSQLPHPFGDYGQCAAETEDGGFIIASVTSSDSTSRDFWIIRTDANGDTLWTKVYGGYAEEESKVVEILPDDTYMFAGRTSSFGNEDGDAWLLITDINGDTLWTKTYGQWGVYDMAYWAETTMDGGMILSGQSVYAGNENRDYYLVKTDEDGNLEWSQNYGGSGEDGGFKVTEVADGYVMCGYTNSFGAGEDDVYIIKVGRKLFSISVVPQNSFTTVEPGGDIPYLGSVFNNSHNQQQTKVWVNLELPDDSYYPLFQPFNVSIIGNGSINYNTDLHVPLFAPIGDYKYIAYCGEYPEIIDSAYFDFTVVGSTKDRNKSHPMDWSATNWKTNNDKGNLDIEKISESRAYCSPNPFNNTTVINYFLPYSSQVTVSFYDILGREVYSIPESKGVIGWNSIEWNPHKLASGTYFYRIDLDADVITGKAVLLK